MKIMLQSEAVKKINTEMTLELGGLEYLRICKFYINMAMVVGLECYSKNMEEIIAMNCDGIEVGRFPGLREAERNLGISAGGISNVLAGRHHTAGGLMFMKVKDKELYRKDEDDIIIDEYILKSKERGCFSKL
jgi:hypothetical protein